MRGFIFVLSFVLSGFVSLPLFAQDQARLARVAGQALDWHMENGRARQAFEKLPKGGDIHTHLRGAIYAETWLDWAAEDGLCVDTTVPAIVFKQANTCEASGWITAEAARLDPYYRRSIIDALSTRSYVPTNGWTGHDQFFETFNRINVAPHRLGDQLAAVAERAGKQNILYLELMETLVLPELFPLVAGINMSGDVATDYQSLSESAFGREIDKLAASIGRQIADARTKKDKLLLCGTPNAKAGCDVEIRFLHQVIREFDPSMVYAQIMLGWAVMEQNPLVVGLNLVAPEDGYVALRDYTYHMEMIDHLYRTRGPQNITLHAGELALGLVRPKQLRFHIREAIEIGHAKRIGHGVAIAYEDDHEALLQKMVDDDILVEINLTSNAVILGVEGQNHPLVLYRDLRVPYTVSTDDEGVSRIDLTHEYIRLAQTFGVSYFELRYVSRNSLSYSFLDGESLWTSDDCSHDVIEAKAPSVTCQQLLDQSEKARLQWKLEEKLRVFEANLKIPKRERTSFE
ncbi:adenosine deaminase family protein [Kordiimonas aquimaris]|uniref:adenosine deaminase family protein n=1 Tax=Kordiimonas aquimaris TaxID=707591 RepID=UPI0021CFF3F5|nr:hypothetical protein [Kordiimonas aquimaris]